MKVSELVKRVNILADEQESADNITGFLNDAISKINIRMKANLPYLDATLDNEPVFDEKWQRALLIPFAVGRIKQIDSSQFEYNDAYMEFTSMLDEMATSYVIPEIYKDNSNKYVDPITGEIKEYTSDIFTTNPLWLGRGW